MTVHELSLCSSIQHVVSRAAGDRTVTVVHLRLGRLRQVVPDTLRYCWGLVTADTALAGSELVIESVAVTARCRACAS